MVKKVADQKFCQDCKIKKIQSQAKRCRQCYFKSKIGHKHSDETKKKIGDANKGNSACAFYKGKKMPKWICNKISEARKGMKFTEAHVENMSRARKGIPNPKVAGKNNGHWVGGKKIQNGYILKLIPIEERLTTKRYIYEHRYVMEKHLGRYLTKEETVHHLNEIKTDNRIKNLILCSSIKEHFEKFHPFGNKNNSISKRQCSLCKKILPISEKYFHRDKNCKLGFNYKCKKCRIILKEKSVETSQNPQTNTEV